MTDIARKRLLSDVTWQYELDALKGFICSEVQVDGMRVPRFGLHSLYAKNMPFFAYDDPYMLQRFGDTAFTDSVHCFFAVPFLEEIMSDLNGQNGMVFLALHEISHPLYRHFHRNLDVPPDIANSGQDLSINTRMLRDYVFNKEAGMNSLFPLPKALSMGCGFQPGDIEKYSDRSEEDICRELMDEARKQQQNKQGSGKPGQGMPGKGSPGSGAKGKGTPGAGAPGSGAPEDGSPEAGQGMGTEHRVTMNDLIDALNQSGLGHIIDILNIPKTADGQAQKMEAQMTDIINAVNKMGNIQAQLGNRTPGSHCANSAKEMIGKLSKPKITWKLATKTAIFGDGMKYKQSFDHASDIWHFDPSVMGIPNRIYDGAHIPSKPSDFVVALLDTSGSMDIASDIRTAVSEIFGLVQSNKQMAPDVILLCADTVGRGSPIVITPQNAEKLIKEQVSIDGRGGTNLTRGIIDAMEHPEVKKRLKAGQKIGSMLFFTDLGDTPPKREDLPAKLPKKFYYMAVPGTYSDKFASSVKDYAITVSMGEKMEINMEASTVRKAPRRF